MTRIAYFDCLAGASGDMLLGALLDAGVPEDDLRRELRALDLPGFQLHSRIVHKNGLRAVKVDVLVEDETTERTLSEILNILAASELPDEIQAQAADHLAEHHNVKRLPPGGRSGLLGVGQHHNNST